MSVYKSVVYHVMVSAVQGNELILDCEFVLLCGKVLCVRFRIWVEEWGAEKWCWAGRQKVDLTRL